MSGEAPLDNGPLIPDPTTEVDHKVNTAYMDARVRRQRQYVYAYDDRLYVTQVRPQTFPCIAVDPAGWAIWLAPGADESELG